MATATIYPALGQTVPDQDGDTIPSGGLTVVWSEYYANLIREGRILFQDPLGIGSSTGAETLANTTIPIYCTDLTARIGVANRSIIQVDGYSSTLDGGEGRFIWRSASTTTADGGVVFGAQATGRWHRIIEVDHYNARWYGATGLGVVDDAPAIDLAMTQALAAHMPCRVPQGTYRLASSITIRAVTYDIVANVFASGPKLYGDGIGNTIFVIAFSGVAIDIQTQVAVPIVAYRGFLGCSLTKFTIKQESAYANTTAIKLRTVYLTELADIHIHGGNMRIENGIHIPCEYGDLDASNQVTMDRIRIENCHGWGIKADASPGSNENSYITQTDVFIQYCGTDSAADPPTSGGMIYKGQCLTQRDVCFEICTNVGLYIPGQTGLASNYIGDNVTHEGCTRRGLYVTGITSFKGRNMQFYNKGGFPATRACEFKADSYTIRHVEIDGCVVRATNAIGLAPLDPYTAFTISGTHAELDTCRVRNIEWSDMDHHTGQIRFSGWKFDGVPWQCGLQFVNDQIVRFHPISGRGGNAMPLRLAGPATGTVASTSGEWVTTTIATDGEAIAPTTGTAPDPEVPGSLIEGGSYAASTRYSVYLWDDDGARKISLSATAPTIDTVSGYPVRTGDPAKLHVGYITTTSAASPNIRWSHVENTFGECLSASAIYDPASLADGLSATTTLTVTGAELGDTATATFSNDLTTVDLEAWVSAPNTVSVRFNAGPATVVGPAVLADISAASSAYFLSPVAGKVTKVFSRLGGPITLADANLTTAISTGGGAFSTITNGGWTVAYTGSALNDVDSTVPTAANTVAAGDILRVTTDGASTTTATLDVYFVISNVVDLASGVLRAKVSKA